MCFRGELDMGYVAVKPPRFRCLAREPDGIRSHKPLPSAIEHRYGSDIQEYIHYLTTYDYLAAEKADLDDPSPLM